MVSETTPEVMQAAETRNRYRAALPLSDIA